MPFIREDATRFRCPECYVPVSCRDASKEGRCRRCRPKVARTRKRPVELEAWEVADRAQAPRP